jgi:hypothetical protein
MSILRDRQHITSVNQSIPESQIVPLIKEKIYSSSFETFKPKGINRKRVTCDPVDFRLENNAINPYRVQDPDNRLQSNRNPLWHESNRVSNAEPILQEPNNQTTRKLPIDYRYPEHNSMSQDPFTFANQSTPQSQLGRLINTEEKNTSSSHPSLTFKPKDSNAKTVIADLVHFRLPPFDSKKPRQLLLSPYKSMSQNTNHTMLVSTLAGDILVYDTIKKCQKQVIKQNLLLNGWCEHMAWISNDVVCISSDEKATDPHQICLLYDCNYKLPNLSYKVSRLKEMPQYNFINFLVVVKEINQLYLLLDQCKNGVQILSGLQVELIIKFFYGVIRANIKNTQRLLRN